MTLKKCQLRKVGFDKEINVGEVFTDANNEKNVIVEIDKINVYYNRESTITIAKVVSQSVKDTTEHLYDDGISEEASLRFNAGKINPFNDKNKALPSVGDVSLMEDEYGKERLYRVSAINGFHYEFTDIVVNYIVTPVLEWTKSEIDKAIAENRRNKFTVIG